MKTMGKMKMKVGPWKKRATTTNRPLAADAAVKETHGIVAEKYAVTLPEEATAASSEAETMIMKASSEVAKGEAAGNVDTLGDMEITLKPTLPVSPLKNAPPPPSTGSPTSQFEYDIMNATHENLDYISLQKSYSLSIMDDKSISSEESLQGENKADSESKADAEFVEQVNKTGEEGCLTACVDEIFVDRTIAKDMGNGLSEFTKKVKKGEEVGLSEFVDDVLSPLTNLSDYMFCRMESNLPDFVEDVNDLLSNDLHHLIFQGEVEEKNKAQEERGVETGVEARAEAGVDEKEEGVEEKNQDEGVEIVCGPSPVDQEGRVEGDEEDDEEGGKEVVVVDGQKGDSTDVEAVLGRCKWEKVMQARFENASYSPVTGLILRKDGRPEPSEDEVLIRVDATTISTRDCLERLRRGESRKLIEEFWVPGHEIVGHVVSTGADAENFLGKRVAALLSYGGGCSQYLCIKAKDAIVLPDEADSNEVVALLSSYMAAYQCLDSVVGFKPKAEDGVESKGDEETNFLSVVESAVDVDDDAESNGEFDIESIMPKEDEDTESMKEEDVGGEAKVEDDTESKKEDIVEPKGDEDEEDLAEPKKEEVAEPMGEEGVKPKEVEDVEPKNEEDVEPKKMEEDEPKDEEDVQQKNEENIDEVEPKKEDDVDVKPKEEKKEDVEPEVEEKNESKGKDIIEDISMIVENSGQKKSPLFGMKVLVVGAGSPVGLAMLDLARNAGALVYAVSPSSHLGAIRETGANHWYELSRKSVWEADWRTEMDLVIDTIGDSDYISSFYTVMSSRGRLVKVNTTSCEKKYEPLAEEEYGLMNLWKNCKELLDMKGYKERVIKDKTVDYNIFHSYKEDKEAFEEDLCYLHELLQVGKIGSKISSRVGFDKLEGEWKKIMAAGGESGVVVVHPWKVGFTRVG